MAGRRCFSEKIVESDAFYALSTNAQALYYHLCQNADDDGFINSAVSVALKVKKGKAALRELTEKRFLLHFKDIYVVKHWRVSNSLKNDRLKPPAYADIAAMIWVKPNRAYTDHPVDGCRTLYEVKTGAVLESTWNPLGILTEENRTEQKGTEQNRTGMWALFTELWNDYPELRRGSEKQAWATFQDVVPSEGDASSAIQNLSLWKGSKQWGKEGGRYVPYLCNWLERGSWKSPPAAEDKGGMIPSCSLGDAEMEAIRRVLSEE